jgi:hypothetical protein
MAYAFNDAAHEGAEKLRAGNERHIRAVAQEVQDLIDQGYSIVGTDMSARIDGMPVRRYDIVAADHETGALIGIEVKTTIGSIFKIDTQQMDFDIKAAQGLAVVNDGRSISMVSYVGVTFSGSLNAYFNRVALQHRAMSQGVRFSGKRQ